MRFYGQRHGMWRDEKEFGPTSRTLQDQIKIEEMGRRNMTLKEFAELAGVILLTDVDEEKWGGRL